MQAEFDDGDDDLLRPGLAGFELLLLLACKIFLVINYEVLCENFNSMP